MSFSLGGYFLASLGSAHSAAAIHVYIVRLLLRYCFLWHVRTPPCRDENQYYQRTANVTGSRDEIRGEYI